MRPLLLCLFVIFYPLSAYAQLSPELLLPEGHTGGLLDNVVFSSNGRYAASGSKTEIITWDLASGSSLIRTPAIPSCGTLLGFTPDNEFILVESDGIIYEKNIITLKTRRRYIMPVMDEKHTIEVEYAVLNPAAHQLIALGEYPGNNQKYFAIWDLKSGRLLRTVDVLTYLKNLMFISRLEISGDGSTLLIWCHNNFDEENISIINLDTFTHISDLNISDFSIKQDESIRSVHLSATGKQVIGCTLSEATFKSQILIWNSSTGVVEERLKRNGQTADVCFIKNDKSIAFVGNDSAYKQPPLESNAFWTCDLPHWRNVKIYKNRSSQLGPMVLNASKELVTTASLPGDISLWNPYTGTPVRTLRSLTHIPTSIISGKDSSLYIGYRTSLDTRLNQSGVFRWHLDDPEASHLVNIPLGSGDPFLFSDSARTALIINQAGRLNQKNIKDGSILEFRVTDWKLGIITYFKEVSLSPSGESIAATHFRYAVTKEDIANMLDETLYVTVWSKSGMVKWSHPIGKNMSHQASLFFSTNEKILYVIRNQLSSNKTRADVISYESATGKILKTQLGENEPYAFSPRQAELIRLLTDGQPGSNPITVLHSMYDGKGDVALDYSQSNALLANVSNDDDSSNSAFSVSKQPMPLTHDSNESGNPCLIDPVEQRIIHRLLGHRLSVTSAKFVTKDLLATGSDDKTVKLWDRQSGREVATLLMLNEEDWMIRTPDNYYMATRSAAKKLFFRLGSRVVSFDQFDLLFNRPDIVLKRIGLASAQLVDLYQRAYKKRLLKLGFSEQNIQQSPKSLPEIRILNKDLLTITRSASLSLQVEATDSLGLLDRIITYVNDVPINGQKGIDLKSMSTKTVVQNLTIPLSTGRNKIQISAFNQQGLESYRELFEIFCEAPNKSSKTHLIAIGVSNYADTTQRLNYAAKDAQDVASLFEKRFMATQNGSVTLLVDNQVTKKSLKSLRNRLMQTAVDDKVVVFLAGHGILDLSTKQWYYATYNADFSNPSVEGIAYAELEDLLDGIPARNKLLMLDACFSGETDEEQDNILANTKQLNNGVTFRGLRNSQKVTLTSSKATSVGSTFNTMKRVFSELRRNSGTTVIAAASGGEFAIEKDQYRNGVFTYAFRNALDTGVADTDMNGKIDVSELQRYIYQQVPKLTNDQQTPTSRQENLELDFTVW